MVEQHAMMKRLQTNSVPADIENHGIELRRVVLDELTVEGFQAKAGQAWCILGGTRSGIDRFVSLLAGGEEAFTAEVFELPDQLAVVSFRGQQELFEEEVRRDDSEFLDRIDPGTPARAFLQPGPRTEQLIRLFRLDHLLDRGYRQLSSGESRKLLLLSAISRGARYLLVENPYDGLDQKACRDFDRTMTELLQEGFGIMLVLTCRADIPPWCSHLAVIEEGFMVWQGGRDVVEQAIREAEEAGSWVQLLGAGAGDGPRYASRKRWSDCSTATPVTVRETFFPVLTSPSGPASIP
jgi:molybdate transport system ATP-binding protein